MTEYKLFNTDGKTFFDFRSNPESRCEGFTLSFLDDGTVVISGDYGTLCWKRNYHHEGDKEFNRDYGFPNKDTGISYFEEKVCQFGIKQMVKDWDEERAKQEIIDYILKSEHITQKEYDDFCEDIHYSLKDIDEDDEIKEKDKYKTIWYLKSQMRFDNQNDMMGFLNELDSEFNSLYSDEGWSYGEDYTHQFKFMFEVLKSVSEQILEAVNKAEINRLENIDETTNEIIDMIRQEFKLNQDSDKDDEIYGFIHNKLKELKK